MGVAWIAYARWWASVNIVIQKTTQQPTIDEPGWNLTGSIA